MRPKEDTVSRPSTGSKMPRPDPIAGSTHAVVDKKINFSGQSKSVGATVKVNGEIVEPGRHSADHLAMLGVDEDSVDSAWHQFLIDSTMRPGNSGAWDAYHQEGMGWQVEIDLLQEGKIEYEQLAYVDPRNGARKVTFWCKRWSGVENPDDVLSPPGPRATFEVVSKTESLDAIYAMGFFWSGVAQGEIDSTAKCSAALKAAREALHDALWEIDLALHVANKAWAGPRAEITKFKFALEREVITPIEEVTHGWETYTHDLVTEQRKAKHQDEELRREILAEVAIDVLVGTMTFGIGWLKAGYFVERLALRAGEIAKVQRALANRYVAKATQLAKADGLIFARRALAHGTKDLSARAIVNTAQGKSPTDGWLLSFAAATGVGGAEFARKYGIDFSLGSSLVKQGTETGAKAAWTNDALGSPFVLGVGADLASDATKRAGFIKRFKKKVREYIENDRLLGQRVAAQADAAYKRDHPGVDLRTVPSEQMRKYIDKEVADEADRLVDPIIDGVIGGSGKGTARAIDGYRDPQETPSLPSGTVRQPLGS